MKVKGLMATSHVLVSIVLLLLVMMIPLDFFQTYFTSLLDHPIKFFFTLIIFIGFTLIVDLDNHISKAGVELGILGNLVTLFMQSTSSVVWNVTKLRGDRPPLSQHRYLWHTPFIFGIFLTTFYFGITPSNTNIFTTLATDMKTKPILEVLSLNSVIVLFIFMAFCATLVGSTLVIVFLKKFIKIEKWYKYLLSIIVMIYLLFVDLTTIREVAVVSVFGYIFHILGDSICDGGIPLLFPIPIGSQMWKRIKLLPVTIKTGEKSNIIIDILATVLIPILFIYIINKR